MGDGKGEKDDYAKRKTIKIIFKILKYGPDKTKPTASFAKTPMQNNGALNKR